MLEIMVGLDYQELKKQCNGGNRTMTHNKVTYGCGCTASGDNVAEFCSMHGDLILRERKLFTVTELDCKLRCIRANIISMKATMQNLDRAFNDVHEAIIMLEELEK